MSHRGLKLTILVALLAAVSVAQDKGKGKGKGDKGAAAPPPPPLLTQQVKPGLFLITGAGGNTGVRVTKDGLIVVDTKNLGDQFYNDLMTQIKGISTAPVKYVVITHHHQDHSGNNGKFSAAGAKVIAHENLNKNLETYAPQQGKPAMPNAPYKKNMTISLGGVKVKIYHFEPAHTSGDSIVYYPDLKVVQCGDVVVGTAPNVDYPFGGSATGWLKTLDKIAKLDFDTVIPGHSAPNQTTMTRADFMAYKMKWETFVSRSKELGKQATSNDQLLAKFNTDEIGLNVNNAQWQNPQRLDAFYADLQKAK
jgi:glyoxylase-like metal-dependent hydrolase (beta-lactamase superfamily II)